MYFKVRFYAILSISSTKKCCVCSVQGTRWAEELEGSAVRPKVIHDLETLLGEKSAFFEGKFILHFVAPIRMEDHITKSTNKNMHANEAKKKHKFQKKKGAK